MDTQIVNDALMTVAVMVGPVVAISAWVAAASALYRRQVYTAQIRTIEEHLEHVAEKRRSWQSRRNGASIRRRSMSATIFRRAGSWAFSYELRTALDPIIGVPNRGAARQKTSTN